MHRVVEACMRGEGCGVAGELDRAAFAVAGDLQIISVQVRILMLLLRMCVDNRVVYTQRSIVRTT